MILSFKVSPFSISSVYRVVFEDVDVQCTSLVIFRIPRTSSGCRLLLIIIPAF